MNSVRRETAATKDRSSQDIPLLSIRFKRPLPGAEFSDHCTQNYPSTALIIQGSVKLLQIWTTRSKYDRIPYMVQFEGNRVLIRVERERVHQLASASRRCNNSGVFIGYPQSY